MPLRESFEQSGQWLFRWRSYLPLFVFLIVLPAMWGYHYPNGDHTISQEWGLFCLAVSFFGLAIRAWVVGTTPKGTSGRNTHQGQVASVLNTSGWYSIVRHPLYVGNYFMWLGIALLPREWWLALLVSLVFWLYYERIMFAEEEFLRRSFGASYEEWASRTPAFVPAFRSWVKPSLPFSMRTVFRREYSGFFGVIASFMLLEIVGDRIATGAFVFDRMWTTIFAVSAALYVTLLLLKRRTRIFDVEGR